MMWLPAATAPFVVIAIVAELTVLVPPAAWSALTNATATAGYSSHSMYPRTFTAAGADTRIASPFMIVDAVPSSIGSRPNGNWIVNVPMNAGTNHCFTGFSTVGSAVYWPATVEPAVTAG